VPSWLKPDQLAQRPYATINARSDRIQTAPTYREPFQKRRCIVPTSGWYEWQKIGAKTKKPFHFQPKAQGIARLGGRASSRVVLWDTDRLPIKGMTK
jgi:putative SOS response-associated peptidase YedK